MLISSQILCRSEGREMQESMVVISLDPGSVSTGYAVLQASATGETLLGSGTWKRSRRERPCARHVANCLAIGALVAAYSPALIAYEEFVYRGGNARIDPNTAKWVDRLIGYLLSLAHAPAHTVVERRERTSVWRLASLAEGSAPVVMGLDAGDWGHALVGTARHGKMDIAWAVNLRLGTAFTGDHKDNHEADACGVGLVALDRYRMAQKCGEKKITQCSKKDQVWHLP